ncbi:MAG: calcium/sodium antiporter, partial [Rhodovibrionaceae bacterium]
MTALVIAGVEVVAGLALLMLGGELLLRGGVALAKRLGIQPLLIGLTVVACATSMPELMVTLTAGFQGVPDIGVGNIVGSNIANILLILGAAALVYPITAPRGLVRRDGMVMLGATALFTLMAWFTPAMTWMHGTLFLVLLVGYLWWSYTLECHKTVPDPGAETTEAMEQAPDSIWIAVLLVIGGVIGLFVGSELLIEGAIFLARRGGVSDAVIGLTLVAIGTSLPELAASVVAAMKRHSDIAIGNVIGSNIFNLLGIFGVLAVVHDFTVSIEILRVDV